MKILFIADSTSIHTQRWLDFFVKGGHEIHIITIGRKMLKLCGVDHIANFDKFGANSIFFLAKIIKTRKIIQKLNPQILHAHFVEQYGWLAAMSNFHPFFLTGWGTDILHLPHASRFKIGNRLTRYALRKADRLTAISEYLKREMVKLGANAASTEVVFCGVDTQQFCQDVDVGCLKQALAIDDSQPVVLTNRHHIELYNNDVVVEAMAIALNRFPNAVLILQNAGGGSNSNLKNLCRRVGIENSVRFLPPSNYDEMPLIYNLADIFVSVPQWDAGPMSLKEAMACGAAPIISEIPAPMELIKNNVNGKVVSVRNVTSLADAIIELLGDKNKRTKWARINRKIIEERAEHNDLMQKIEKMYRLAIS
jgi:glycosyltransferase involved in cell wall biosynthesis